MTTNATIPVQFEFPDDRHGRKQRQAELIARQANELSRKHLEHGRPCIVSILYEVDGSVSVFGGYPAGRVKDE